MNKIQISMKLTINKYFLLIVIFSFFSSISLFSQGINNWSIIKKFKQLSISSQPKIEQFDSLIFLPNCSGENKFFIIDFDGNERVFSTSSGHIPQYITINDVGFSFSSDGYLYYPHLYSLNGGLVKFSNIGEEPKCEYIYFKKVFDVQANQEINIPPIVAINSCTFDKQPAFCYIYVGDFTIDTSSLRFVKASKPDSIIAEFKVPKYNPDADTNNGFRVSLMERYVYVNDSLIFFRASLPENTIIKFNTNNKEFTRYCYLDLIVYDTTLSGITTLLIPSNYSNTKDYHLSNGMNNFWLVKVIQQDNSKIKISNFLLTYIPDIGFKSISIIPKNLKYYKGEGNFDIVRFGILGNDSSFYFVYKTDEDNKKSVLYKTEIVIYNIFTDEYKSICIPPELIVWEEGDDPYNFGPYPRSEKADEILAVSRLTNPDNEKILAVLLSTGHLLFYNLKTGEILDNNRDLFKDFDISKIYPNPTSEVSTAEIMCYVQDISNLDIGLYNLFGHKILDLNNNYSYNSLTHTISTTFNIPKGTSKGTYYLNVSNGIERRTQAIVIK